MIFNVKKVVLKYNRGIQKDSVCLGKNGLFSDFESVNFQLSCDRKIISDDCVCL